MIKNSSFDFAYDYLRFDTTWLFEWDVNDITADTIKFYPFTEEGTSRTWWFKNRGDVTIQSHDEQIWDSSHPWLEYDAANPDAWNASHPNNPTRYLAPGSSFITITNSIETVVIDNVPPAFVSDKGTEYVWICNRKSNQEVRRHCEFIFRDQAGLDFKNFEIKVGDVIAYSFKRKDPEGVNNPLMEKDTDQEYYIDPDTLKIASDGFHTYKVQFDLLYGADDDEIAILNEQGLAITVWDKAGNASTYTFGQHGSETRRWVLIDTVDDISDLQPMVIKFYDHDPKNMVVDEDTYGSVWCSVYNPNVEFYEAGIEIMAGLKGDYPTDEQSHTKIHDFATIGDIDISTYDTSEYEKTGVIRFKIINIKEAGYVEVNAWLETGVKLFDDMVKTSTYAEEKCGPWIIMDAEGRKYNIQRYVPKYLRNTDYFEFIKFFELYLNTVYTNMTKGTNISILEKIAKIGDFNDIDRIENSMIWHYARQFGMEFDIDLKTMQDLNLGFAASGVVTDSEGKPVIIDGEVYRNPVLNDRTEDDVIDILKFALKNLPMYNQLKGSEKGMVFAMKMFSLSCKVINLWCKLGPEVEDHPDFVEEDRMFDFTSHFLTSRFNLEFNSLNVDFPTFNDNLEVFVRFIKSIKPIVRILNLIKYTIIFEYDYYWLMNPYVHDDFGNQGDDSYDYLLTWKREELEEMIEKSQIDWKVMHADRIWINFNPASIAVKFNGEVGSEDQAAPNISNGYTLLATMLNESRHRFIFRMAAKYNFDFTISVMDKRDQEQKWYGLSEGDNGLVIGNKWDVFNDDAQDFDFVKEINLSDIDTKVCDTGFFIYPKDGEMATHLAQFVKPAYFTENWVNDTLDTYRKRLLAQYADDPAKVNYINNLVMDLVITNPDTCCEIEMISKIKHVPGTEICYCYSEVPEPSWVPAADPDNE